MHRFSTVVQDRMNSADGPVSKLFKQVCRLKAHLVKARGIRGTTSILNDPLVVELGQAGIAQGETKAALLQHWGSSKIYARQVTDRPRAVCNRIHLQHSHGPNGDRPTDRWLRSCSLLRNNIALLVGS